MSTRIIQEDVISKDNRKCDFMILFLVVDVDTFFKNTSHRDFYVKVIHV